MIDGLNQVKFCVNPCQNTKAVQKRKDDHRNLNTFLDIKRKKLDVGKNISQKVYPETLLGGEISVVLKRKLLLIPLEERGFMNC